MSREANRPEVTRRGFLSALAAGGVLSLGLEVGCGGGRERLIKHAEQTGELSPNLYVTVKRDGRVGLEVEKIEFGQGVATMYATLVAEELDVAVEAVDIHHADSLPEYRTTLGMQLTGGSQSTKDGFLPVRRAAAAAKEMLVAAAAAEWGVPASECTTEAGHVVHPSGKKAGYGELTIKASKQPIPDAPRLKAKGEFRLIGKRNRRVDLRPKVDGTARFGTDVVVPGMVRAYVLHGPVFGADAKSVQADAAKKRPGVLDVFAFPGGVAIVAEKFWQARAAAADVTVEWGQGEVAGLDTEAMRAKVASYGEPGEAARDDGNADKAIAGARAKVDVMYEGPYLAHAPMEPQNCTVKVDGRRVEIWGPVQSPSIVQAYVASALHVSEDDVLVHTTLAGGAFGRRTYADFVVQAAHIAKHVGRPVQMIWTRESDMTQAYYRPQLAVKMRGGVTADGRVAGASVHSIGQSLTLSFLPALPAAMPGVPGPVRTMMVNALKGVFATDTITDMFSTEGIANTSYVIENFRVAFSALHTKLPIGVWRSVGHSFSGFAMESFVDELAHAAQVDPLEMRRRMLPENSRPRRVLDACAQLAQWGSPSAPGRALGLARHTSFESEVCEIAEVAIENGRIKVKHVYAVVDCGTVVNPDIVKAQVEGAIVFGLSAALDQEITLVNGVVQQTNYDTFPVLRMHEAPRITVQILDSDEPPTGIGEPGLPPIAPAVANAIFRLTGKRLRRLPLQRSLDEASK